MNIGVIAGVPWHGAIGLSFKVMSAIAGMSI